MTTSEYGVTDGGFTVKPIDVLLAEVFARARAAFGPDVDLTVTSPLRKILEVAAQEDAELWKRLEDGYYAGFASTASGDNLDLHGEDVGVERLTAFATGTVTLTLSGGVPGRDYLLGEATVVTASGTPGIAFTTDTAVTLTAAHPAADVTVTCLTRGPAGNLPAAAVDAVDPAQLQVYYPDFAPAVVAVTNAQPLAGGGVPEADDAYRGRLLGIPRTVWTLEAVEQAVLGVDGVIDVLLSDPLGGVDVTQSYFNTFDFGERLFSAERRFGEAYTFDVVVAHDYRWPWQTIGVVDGIADRVGTAVDAVRPPGIHPNLIEADHIDIGVRADVVAQPGYDAAALLARITDRIRGVVSGLRLGSNVLASQVMRAFTDEPGVVDVQDLHLRRGPATFGRITLGGVPYQAVPTEAGVGENLTMSATELAIFRPDSGLTTLQVVTP